MHAACKVSPEIGVLRSARICDSMASEPSSGMNSALQNSKTIRTLANGRESNELSGLRALDLREHGMALTPKSPGQGTRPTVIMARAKTTSDFGAESPSPRPSPIGWERENRPPSVGVSDTLWKLRATGLAVPSPVGRERVRVRVVLLVLRLLSGTCFCTNPEVDRRSLGLSACHFFSRRCSGSLMIARLMRGNGSVQRRDSKSVKPSD